MTDFTPYEQLDLSYDFNALEPVISAEIMELHYTKHHAGYVKNLNAALEQYFEANQKRDLEKMIALQKAIQFNGGGHVNHSIFWTNLAPQGAGGAPSAELAAYIDQQFGSLEKLIQMFNGQTAAVQGSGWGWLGYCPKEDIIKIFTCHNQDSLSIKGAVPLLGVDVWEHAYYLQYKNRRDKYLEEIWRIVNWSNVSERFKLARSPKAGRSDEKDLTI